MRLTQNIHAGSNQPEVSIRLFPGFVAFEFDFSDGPDVNIFFDTQADLDEFKSRIDAAITMPDDNR